MKSQKRIGEQHVFTTKECLFLSRKNAKKAKMLFEGGTQKYTEIRRKEGDAVVLLKEIIQELFQKCKFFYQELES